MTGGPVQTKMTVESVTVSQILEVHSGGEKKSSFVSATVRLNPPVSLEQLRLAQVEVAMQVYTAVIHDAVATCSITEQSGRSRLEDARANFTTLRDKLKAQLEAGASEPPDRA